MEGAYFEILSDEETVVGGEAIAKHPSNKRRKTNDINNNNNSNNGTKSKRDEQSNGSISNNSKTKTKGKQNKNSNNSTSTTKYSYDQSTRDVISSEPLLPDPYEQHLVYVKNSDISGGMFTYRSIYLSLSIYLSIY